MIRRIETGFSQDSAETLTTPTLTPDFMEQPVLATPTAATETTTLIFWVPPQLEPIQSNPAGMLLSDRLKDFESSHPDLKVELRVKAMSGESSLLNSLSVTTAVAPLSLPGLILLDRSDMETAALKNLIFPIPNRTAEYATSDWLPFTDSLSSVQGTQFGLPLFADPLVMVYRRQMVAFPPATWQELVNQPNPVVFNLGDPSAAIPYSIYLSSGGRLVNEEGQAVLEPDALTRTYQTLFNGSSANVFPTWLAEVQSPEAVWDAFQKGQSTYALVWGSQSLQNPVENMAVSPIPGNSMIGFVNGWLLCFTNPANELSRNYQILAEYLLEPDFLAKWSESAGYLPVQRSILAEWQDQELASMFASAAEQLIVLPPNEIRHQTGSLLNSYGTSLIRRQTSPMQAVLDTLDALEVK
jgi:ABC-type glycerol-3-phosphate transport system substrate-binding protein